MTDTMSSEGDSSKSVLSESNEKSGTDNTDSSQDSHDVNDSKAEKSTIENDVEKKGDEKAPKEDSEAAGKSADKKSEVDEKTENDKKSESEAEVENEEDKDKKDNKVKKEKKEKEKVEEKSENSEQDEEDDEGKKPGKKESVPLLDQPLEKSGKRERKNVQRFNEEFAAEVKEGTKIDFDVGSGIPLGDIPRVDASISRFKNDDLKLLHKLLFKIPGKTTMIKKNIRKFNGFDFKKNSEEYSKRVAFAHKYEVKQLKSVCEMLDLLKTGTKDDIIERIIDFLLEPKDSGKAVGGGRPKRSAAVRANNRGYSSHDDYSSDEKQSSRAKRDKGKRQSLKDDSSSDEDFQPNQSDGSDERPRVNKRKRKPQKKESSEEEASDVSVSSDESDDDPKAKRKKSPAKVNNKTKAKSTPGRRGRPPASAKKTPTRGRKAKATSEEEEEEEESDHKEDGSSSEDEPLAKKAKSSQPPTDDEIKTFIKSVLEGANLEEITMKTVCQRVYDHYPDFDLTHKKDFIKSTVKSLIST